MESRVESGRVDRHPISGPAPRSPILAVATRGSEEQKGLSPRGQHVPAQVLFDPDSPVNTPLRQGLQLWVAACLYKGAVDVFRIFVGEMDEETAERHYRDGMALGTTLQVRRRCGPPIAWRSTYWQESLEQVRIDDAVRDYLYPSRFPDPGVGCRGDTAGAEGLNCSSPDGSCRRSSRQMRFEGNPDKQRASTG